MSQARAKAHQMIEDYHVKRGQSLFLQVFGNEEQGLPAEVIQPPGIPTRIDLFGGRPTNVGFDEKVGFEVDLCFHGSPVPHRCSFKWTDVVAISTDPNEGWMVLLQPATAVLLEDNRFAVHITMPRPPAPADEEEAIEEDTQKEIPTRHLSVVK